MKRRTRAHSTFAPGMVTTRPLSRKARRRDPHSGHFGCSAVRALNERDLSEKRKAATAQRIALGVRNAYVQLDSTRARVTTAHTARELASRKLDVEQKKCELGTSTVRFVLEEQRNLAQAETDEIQALV